MLFYKLVKIFFIDFDSQHRGVKPKTDIVKTEVSQPYFSPVKPVEQFIIKGRIIGKPGGHTWGRRLAGREKSRIGGKLPNVGLCQPAVDELSLIHI